MKPIAFVFFVIILAATFASCKKEYTCHCYTPATEEVKIYQLKDTRKQAKKYCALYSGSGTTCQLIFK